MIDTYDLDELHDRFDQLSLEQQQQAVINLQQKRRSIINIRPPKSQRITLPKRPFTSLYHQQVFKKLPAEYRKKLLF